MRSVCLVGGGLYDGEVVVDERSVSMRRVCLVGGGLYDGEVVVDERSVSMRRVCLVGGGLLDDENDGRVWLFIWRDGLN